MGKGKVSLDKEHSVICQLLSNVCGRWVMWELHTSLAQTAKSQNLLLVTIYSPSPSHEDKKLESQLYLDPPSRPGGPLFHPVHHDPAGHSPRGYT